MKRKLHNIFTSGSLISCKSVKSTGKLLDLSNNDDAESISSLYSHIPSSVSNKPGKVSVTSLRKMLDDEERSSEFHHEEVKFGPVEKPNTTQPIMRKVLQSEPKCINLQHRPNIHNKLIVQNHHRVQP
ncbi:MAG: hypothetical protein JST59_01985 [Actinobacteria bacterium]|nr:hypothetical protein [Actinomycetota bacterium]